MILLTTIDHLWKDHLLAMDHLREGIGLQGYGQKDPLIEYKKGGFRFFSMMMEQITGDVVRKIFSVQFAPEAMLDEDALTYELEETPSEMQYNITEDGSLVPSPKLAAPAPTQQQPLFAPTPRAPRQMTLGRGPVGGGLSMASGGASSGMISAQPQIATSNSNDVAKVGRNDICPCGSGKKYKKCHGA